MRDGTCSVENQTNQALVRLIYCVCGGFTCGWFVLGFPYLMCMNATGDANVPLISPVLHPLVSPITPPCPSHRWLPRGQSTRWVVPTQNYSHWITLSFKSFSPEVKGQSSCILSIAGKFCPVYLKVFSRIYKAIYVQQTTTTWGFIIKRIKTTTTQGLII